MKSFDAEKKHFEKAKSTSLLMSKERRRFISTILGQLPNFSAPPACSHLGTIRSILSSIGDRSSRAVLKENTSRFVNVLRLGSLAFSVVARVERWEPCNGNTCADPKSVF